MKYTFLIILFSCCWLAGQAQVGLQAESISILQQAKIASPQSFDELIRSSNKSDKNPKWLGIIQPFLNNPLSPTHVPNVFSTNDLAFFCRIELNLEKTTKIPIKFRLGEVQQVEALEQKHPSTRIQY